jgi:hypothetical protein
MDHPPCPSRGACPWAKSQVKSAVRAPPTCSEPVGLGAKRTRTGDVAGSVIGKRSSANGVGERVWGEYSPGRSRLSVDLQARDAPEVGQVARDER